MKKMAQIARPLTLLEKLQLLVWTESVKKIPKPPERIPKKTHLGLINDSPHITCLIGRKGSGKTHRMLKLLRDKDGWKNVYREVIIISPTFKLQDAWNSISPEGVVVYEEFSEETLSSIYEQQNSKIASLLILDDNGQDIRSINQAVFNKFISNSRHLNCSIIALLQKVTQAPTILRTNTDCFVVFAATSTRERDVLWAEIGILDKQAFASMFNDATIDQYSCFVATMQKGKLCFYKNFETEYKITNPTIE